MLLINAKTVPMFWFLKIFDIRSCVFSGIDYFLLLSVGVPGTKHSSKEYILHSLKCQKIYTILKRFHHLEEYRGHLDLTFLNSDFTFEMRAQHWEGS